MALPLKTRIGLALRSALGIEQARYRRSSYAQEGEDLLLARFFGAQASGFYVDVGAHDPFRFSNTALLHARGWRGINIDPLPGAMDLFDRFRPGDVNLAMGIAETAGEATYFQFDEPLLNTFDEATARERDAAPFRIVGRIAVPVRPLAQVLAEHVPPGTTIDLLSVDVEGLDLAVLRSNDWTRFSPRVVVAEVFGKDLGETLADPLTAFMDQQGYAIHAKTLNSVLFAREAPRLLE